MKPSPNTGNEFSPWLPPSNMSNWDSSQLLNEIEANSDASTLAERYRLDVAQHQVEDLFQFDLFSSDTQLYQEQAIDFHSFQDPFISELLSPKYIWNQNKEKVNKANLLITTGGTSVKPEDAQAYDNNAQFWEEEVERLLNNEVGIDPIMQENSSQEEFKELHNSNLIRGIEPGKIFYNPKLQNPALPVQDFENLKLPEESQFHFSMEGIYDIAGTLEYEAELEIPPAKLEKPKVDEIIDNKDAESQDILVRTYNNQSASIPAVNIAQERKVQSSGGLTINETPTDQVCNSQFGLTEDSDFDPLGMGHVFQTNTSSGNQGQTKFMGERSDFISRKKRSLETFSVEESQLQYPGIEISTDDITPTQTDIIGIKKRKMKRQPATLPIIQSIQKKPTEKYLQTAENEGNYHTHNTMKCCARHGNHKFNQEKTYSKLKIILGQSQKKRPKGSKDKYKKFDIKYDSSKYSSTFERLIPSNFGRSRETTMEDFQQISEKVYSGKADVHPPCVYIARARWIRKIGEFIEQNDTPKIGYTEGPFDVRRPYDPQIIRFTIGSNGCPIVESRAAICAYCEEPYFYNLKNSAYGQHLAFTHGIFPDNFLTPIPLYPNVYVISKVDNIPRERINRTRNAHERERPGVVCPCCFQVIETECSISTREERPLTKYLRHFKSEHTGEHATTFNRTIVYHPDQTDGYI